MTTNDLTTSHNPNLTAIITMATAGMTEHTRRAYEKSLTEFLAWYAASGKTQLDKATVQEYKAILSDRGLSSATVNLRLFAIRKLAS